MEEQATLLGAQLKHMVVVMDAKLDRIELNQVNLKEMIEYRLQYLEKQFKDYEERILASKAGMTQVRI